MKRILFAALFLCAALAPATAQSDYVSDDAGKTTGGLWTEVGVTKTLPYNLSLGLDAGFRTNEWFDEASRFDIGLGLSWKPSKNWKFGVGYTFLMKHYSQETSTKSVTEYEWKYRAAGATENTDFTEFMGAPFYTADDATVYSYRGYNQDVKNYTRVTESYWRAKHRISIDGAFTYKFWKWLRLSLRERYQLTFVPSKEITRTRTGTKATTKYRDPNYNENGLVDGELGDSYDEIEGPTTTLADEETTKEKDSKTIHVLRSRLTLEVDKKGWKWSPFCYFEVFNNLGESMHVDKYRISAGVEYAVSSAHKLSLGYVFNHENDDDGDMNIHAICVGYKFKF